MAQGSNATSIEGLQPSSVWRLFAEMAAVPRPSKKEEQIRAHMRATAEKLGFSVREDNIGNMVIDVPATPGYEKAATTVIQGHVDMVCEKNSDTQHDFERQGITTVIDRDAEGEQIVRAAGTTLGADNGIGVCLGLAAACEPDVVHGPLELLLTVDEEQGMSGAKALQGDFVKGRRLINLDSEDDTVLYIGCAGGCDVNLSWSFKRTAAPAGHESCMVKVSGLRGGHSGGDIHENRANANKILNQVLVQSDENLQLAEITGGKLRNVIPREASAVVVGPAGVRERLSESAQRVQDMARRDHHEAGCTIEVTPASATSAISVADTQRLLTAVAALPHGVLAVVPEIPGLVQTSNNVSTVNSEANASGDPLAVRIGCLSRSSSEDQIQTTVRQIASVGTLAGAEVKWGNDYPGWQPNLDSAMLATCRRLYQQLFEQAPNVTAIHAGLECGIIGKRIPGMDMISFGPRIVGAHSPDEQVYVKSVEKIWDLLQTVLKELAEQGK